MLDFMRRNAGSLAVKITLGVIALVFIFFMGGGGQIGSSAGAVVTVGDAQISAIEFEQAWRRNESFYRQQYGERLTPELLKSLDIPSLTLNQLVESAVVRQEAERLGLRVPDEALRSQIRQLDAFQRDGQFSPTMYRLALEGRGMSPGAFETSIRRDMLADQLLDVIRQGVHLSEEDAFREWSKTAEKISLSYIRVPGAKFEGQVSVSEEALTKYFEERADVYRQPEAVRLRYLAYTPAHFAGDIQVKDEAVEEYYVLNENEFTRDETVSARHILKKTAPDADDAAKGEVRAAIEKIKARLDAGDDFAKVATEQSEDTGSAVNGGDLGAFARGKMVKPFEEAAFALKVDETSGIVESPFGFHIIRVYARQEAGKQPLAEVRDEIVTTLRNRDATERAFELAASDAADLRDGRSTMAKIAETRRLEEKSTQFLAKGDIVPDVGANPAFMEEALALTEKGATTDPVRVDNAYYVIQLEERRDAHVPELSEVRDKVETALRQEQALELATKKATELVSAVEGGKSLEDVAKAEGLEVSTTEAFTRGGAFVPGLGSVRGLKEVAFQTHEDGEVLPRSFSHQNDAFVFVRKSFEQADREEFNNQKDEVTESVRQSKEQAAVAEFIRSLKESTNIAYNNEFLSRYIQN